MTPFRPSRPPTSPVPPGLLALITAWCATLLAGTGRPGPRTGRDRGDVPGWVMITLMTAGLVIALWTVAGDRLAALFTQALDAVTKVL